MSPLILTTNATPAVRNNPELSRFELDTPAGLAVADYHLSGETISFYHTEVPVHVRGRGIGYQLACGMLNEVQRLNLKVVPQCWFVREVIDRNPEFQSLPPSANHATECSFRR